ncbi:MAG: hypothetical protein EBR82_37405 [Caulobacteraceae bacterium]|nr:hypothetical protein [Caulobacteraceae bacterium]
MIFLITIAGLFGLWLLIDTYLINRWGKDLVNSINKIYDGLKAFIAVYVIDSITNTNGNDSDDDDAPEVEDRGEA